MREGELREPKGEGSLHAVFSPKYVRTLDCSPTHYSIFIEFKFIELIKVRLFKERLGICKGDP